MIVHKLVKRGSNHKDFCEDFYLTQQLDEKNFICAVFDGCSSGTDSHFASALFAKLFKASAVEIYGLDRSNFSFDDLFKEILYRFVCKLSDVKQKLMLTSDEVLSTLIFMLFNTETNQARIIAVGDGFININGKRIQIDQNNRPEYIAYKLDLLTKKDYFDFWLGNFQQMFDAHKIHDISIATDGIFSFQKNLTVDTKEDEINEAEIIRYFTEDEFLIDNSSMLSRKYNLVKSKNGFENFDDVCIIRIINK